MPCVSCVPPGQGLYCVPISRPLRLEPVPQPHLPWEVGTLLGLPHLPPPPPRDWALLLLGVRLGSPSALLPVL